MVCDFFRLFQLGAPFLLGDFLFILWLLVWSAVSDRRGWTRWPLREERSGKKDRYSVAKVICFLLLPTAALAEWFIRSVFIQRCYRKPEVVCPLRVRMNLFLTYGAIPDRCFCSATTALAHCRRVMVVVCLPQVDDDGSWR